MSMHAAAQCIQSIQTSTSSFKGKWEKRRLSNFNQNIICSFSCYKLPKENAIIFVVVTCLSETLHINLYLHCLCCVEAPEPNNRIHQGSDSGEKWTPSNQNRGLVCCQPIPTC